MVTDIMKDNSRSTTAEQPLDTSVTTALADYFEHLGRRINRMVKAIPHDRFWERPFTFGNSLGILVVHITGSLNHFVGKMIIDTDYVRCREKEFIDQRSRSVDNVMAEFNEALSLTVGLIRSQTAEDLIQSVDFCDSPARDRVGLFIVSAGHVNNHIGQMAYLLHAQGIHMDDQTW